MDTPRHAATITLGKPGVLHGAKSYLMQDDDGQTIESHSISAGLDYPGVGPEHAYLADIGRVHYEPITDTEAMDAFSLLCRTEGIIPAIESSHALAGVLKIAARKIAAGADAGGNHHHREPLGPRRQGRGNRRRMVQTHRHRSEGCQVSHVSKSAAAIAAARAEGRPALICYLPAGFPDVQATIDAAVAMAENGADIIEVGIPYSDPVMDGSVIQAATVQSLAAGLPGRPGLRHRQGHHRALLRHRAWS